MEPEIATAVPQPDFAKQHEQHLRLQCLQYAIQGSAQGDIFNIMRLAEQYSEFVLEGQKT